MPLFVTHHAHAPEACPASTEGGAALLAHVSAASAARHGVSIQAEALLDAHHLVLIVEAAGREQVEAFMAFFAPRGEVQVLGASSAEDAVARGGCSLDHPSEPSECFGRRSA